MMDSYYWGWLSYEDQLKTPEWQNRRYKILCRDEFRCRLCRTKDCLQVHHLYYHKNTMAWDYPDSALITLCPKCHKKEHEKKDGKLVVDQLDEALERLIIVAKGVRQWCETRFFKEDGEKTDGHREI